MKIIKKNQLAILVIALMLITAGYLNYDTNYGAGQEASTTLEDTISLAELGDAELVSSSITEEKDKIEEEQNIKEENEEISSISNNKVSDDYFVKSKLERNVMYSQMIERYQDIINSNNQAAEQKAIAQEEINKINELQNAIMISESLLSSKGFENSVIFINGTSISIIIGGEELSASEVAQVQNIVSRELNAEVDNIHISVK